MSVPAYAPTATYFIGTIDSESGHQGGLVPARSNDLRYLNYWGSLNSGSSGVGINQWIIYDFASPRLFNNIIAETNLTNGSQPKRVKLEVSNNKTTWTNLSLTPGIENWPQSTTDVLYADVQPGQTVHVIEMLADVTARYLRYTVIDNSNIPVTTYASTSGVYLLYVNPNITPPPPPPPPPVQSVRGHVRGLGPTAY